MYSVIQIKNFIEENRLDKFYNNRAWRNLAKKIRTNSNNECQICKSKGKYSPATTVHHVLHLKKFPQFAYTEFYIDEKGKKQKQLVALCHECHEEQHSKKKVCKQKFTNEELW